MNYLMNVIEKQKRLVGVNASVFEKIWQCDPHLLCIKILVWLFRYSMMMNKNLFPSKLHFRTIATWITAMQTFLLSRVTISKNQS